MPVAEEEIRETRVRKKMKLEAVLGIILLLSIAMLIGVVILCMPYFNPQPTAQIPPETTTAPTTTAPTEPETTEPTLPPPEANPYWRNDFQYNDNNFLYCLKGESVVGIDVSAHQQTVDWQQVADSGVEFVMIRVAYRGYGEEGNLREDAYARANLKGASKAGLKIGVYLFSQAINVEEALEEADFLLSIIGDYADVITLPVVFDWERINREGSRTQGFEDTRLLTDCTLAFCQRIEEAGFTPMVYFNTFHARDLIFLAELKQYPFWLALYSDRMRYPYQVDIWQYTDSGSVPGISGPVDLNVGLIYPQPEPPAEESTEPQEEPTETQPNDETA